jgi:adenine-specific DNA-methyltransferase
MISLKEKLENLLKKEKEFLDENGEIDYIKIKDLADKIDNRLIELLITNNEVKKKFFSKIKDVYVFNINHFKFFLDESKVNNSYTQYKNRIGLSAGKEFIQDQNNIVLDFPFKDCVLEGGQSTEEGMDTYFEYFDKKEVYEEEKEKRNEIFFNQILAHDEIDRLFDNKTLINWKRFTKNNKNGPEKVKEINRQKTGLIEENLIIKGNNLLALHSLKNEFSGKIKLIYIDPPYNTKGNANTFVYNNNFNHSTWLTFMKNRLEVSKIFLKEDGFIAIAIDHFELLYLGVLADEIFGEENRLGIVSVLHNPEGRQNADFFTATNEFLLVYAKNKHKAKFNKVVLQENHKESKNTKELYPLKDENGNYKLEQFIRLGGGNASLRKNKPNGFYPLYVSKDLQKISITKKNNFYEIFPITERGQERTWKIIKDNVQPKIDSGELVAQKNNTGNVVIYEKYRESKGSPITTFWLNKKYNAKTFGTNLLNEYFDEKVFSYPKSIYAVIDPIKIMTNENDYILDFFGGSGTTAEAVLKLNKEDEGSRKFILIEQMDYAQSVIPSRLSKALQKNKFDDSFIYCELAKWNEQAKEEIQNAKNLSSLVKLFDILYEKYFLNYNVKIKDFKEKIIKEENFKKLTLDQQKKMFLAMLDLNQMYVNESEMSDKKYGISAEDQKLTKAFYSKK